METDGYHESIAAAARLLRAGKVVAFPTETVYGLGADARNPDAVRSIFRIKGRPANHPLIVHLGRIEGLEEWASEVPATARQLAERFWPGPLTLVLPRHESVLDEITGGQDTVALRVPDHPVALDLLREFGGGLAAPSANRFGHVSPTCAAHVRAGLGYKVATILDGGECRVGLESTIVSLAGEHPHLLRPGGIPASALEEILGESLRIGQPAKPVRVSGALPSHYAPRTPMQAGSPPKVQEWLTQAAARGENVAVMAYSADVADISAMCGAYCEHMPPLAADYANRLYATFHELDGGGFDRIFVEAPPSGPEWSAIHDRLHRADSRSA